MTNDGRHDQRFPTLTRDEIARAERFGERRRFATGQSLFRTGDKGIGLFVLIDGRVGIERHDGGGLRMDVADHRAGAIIGEVAGLQGHPALVDGTVLEDSEVIILSPAGLRALLVADANLGERITRALILRRVDLLAVGAGGPLLIAPTDNAASVGLANFLTRNGWPFRRLDPATDVEAADIVGPLHLNSGDFPIAVLADGTVLKAPDEAALAQALGMIGDADETLVYDVAIVGAGPAGLAASVYAASEGLTVLVLDQRSFGGQAGASARIENYFGFPTGITGQALTARGFVQAQKFGVEIAIPRTVARLECGDVGGIHRIHTAGGGIYRARSVVIASGARYRRPALANLEEFEGRGVWYWASPLEAKFCSGQEVALVGGGNSAGQAAVFLADHASKVRVLVRGEGLAATMSRYLIDRIDANARIEVMPYTEIAALHGDAAGLNAVTWRDRSTKAETTAPIRNLFLFIGADPASEWLFSCGVALDEKGFVTTHPGTRSTSHPGIFAIGDVRSTSVKRVGGAIGEGAAVVAEIHAYLSTVEPVRP
jgi:thioredoxin reductase (NADPH)